MSPGDGVQCGWEAPEWDNAQDTAEGGAPYQFPWGTAEKFPPGCPNDFQGQIKRGCKEEETQGETEQAGPGARGCKEEETRGEMEKASPGARGREDEEAGGILEKATEDRKRAEKGDWETHGPNHVPGGTWLSKSNCSVLLELKEMRSYSHVMEAREEPRCEAVWADSVQETALLERPLQPQR
ncbi:hypothetical protein NDU88_010240 [Pleurodeles waltl]|uniref:Uncharacterized protein n=1 Tax=Pleurodeles waltl TaxID=8319 RepID=A0AAV7S3D3_PLEWA|nr:hypothetical protein NDU88_010240 [Pleurodeles waltl]